MNADKEIKSKGGEERGGHSTKCSAVYLEVTHLPNYELSFFAETTALSSECNKSHPSELHHALMFPVESPLYMSLCTLEATEATEATGCTAASSSTLLRTPLRGLP